ncbi:tRNA pseudouridine(38-40) synthase TruA [Leptobacterium flavescens]|uniref:tRNA pseudouridine synthase A n=1 Tax=Leptobacterium flavescens TaxID=472055 RepID=A0A6P0UQB7_9FLAO|nr:tRNA pseudouridine(38-40) synthase TruA [Leptobacterium flavescens]NER15315.1 tRNA pseudouridine(38-40) synthase TruA [Leptobacterium flavescens]
MRYFLEFSYDGKQYHGWQKQPNAISVQETIENAISLLLRAEIEVVGAGRTDAGVHARQMYAHFDTDEIEDRKHLIHRLNSFLPGDIAIHNIHPMEENAHARFNATSRTYEYWIIDKKDPFLKEYTYRVNQKPDIDRMNEAAEVLFDYEDFQCFSKSHTDVKTYICKMMRADWQYVDGKLVFTIKADRFLRNMVRAVVGTLLEVGMGRISKEDVKKIIESKNRSKAGASVPAHALYLTRVEYPKTFFTE